MTLQTALPIADLHARLVGGGLRIPDLIGQSLAAIERLNPTYRAFSHLAGDALAQAEALQAELYAGRIRGPLHGLAVGVKGSIPVAGLPWTEGTNIFRTRVAQRDAGVVQRVRDAGGIVLGTTTLSELAMYGVTNAFEPMGLNPWDMTRTAGGSSTGAGVSSALGITQVDIGTDSGGSIRNPACHCGVVGFMPRIGGLSAEGKANHAPSLSTIGLIGRSVVDVETAWDVLSDVPGARIEAPRRRLLVLRELVDTMCDDETLGLFAAACARMEEAGFELVDGEVPGWMAGEHAAGIVSLFECGQSLARMDISLASDGIRQRAANAAKLDATTVDTARATCAALRRALPSALQAAGAGAVFTPTWPFAAPGLDVQSLVVRGRSVPIDPHRNCFVRAANAVDACAISLPMGLYRGARVPAGVHLTAPGGDERMLLALARVAEGCLPALPPLPVV
ncbi:MAG: amidase [bacterium]|jgi:Asp-tRNA(Asn)/Glu-tRNA(Gln) amidotransferase A subunit family amidase|nr:amidase [Betaproteobacteria bacterium]